MLFTGWEVRIVKNCDRGLENAARAGKIENFRPLLEPIRLQDLENSARSQAKKKIINIIHLELCTPTSLISESGSYILING